MEQLPPNPWLRWFTRILMGGFAMHCGWLAWVQCVNPALPEDRTESTESVTYQQGLRGTIVDVRGMPLAISQRVFTLRADPVIISNEAPTFARFVAPLLGMSAQELEPLLSITSNIKTGSAISVTNAAGQVTSIPGKAWTNRSVVVKTSVSREDRERIAAGLRKYALEEEKNRRTAARANPRDRVLRRETEAWLGRIRRIRVLGITADAEEQRIYPHEGLASHVLGFVTNQLDSNGRPTDDLGGVMGIEKQFNEQLRGRAGMVQTHRIRQSELPAHRELELAPVDGLNVQLTIDLGIQSVVEQALANGMQRLKPEGIVALVSRPQTGEILGMASAPTFSPGGGNVKAQTVNFATRLELEPGSIFKVFTYASVLEAEKARLDEQLAGENGLWVYKTGRTVDRIRDDHSVRGMISVEDCFAQSLNSAAAKLVLRLEPNIFVKHLREFGFGEPTGVPLGREERGRVWGPEHARVGQGWDGLTQSRMAYGYSVRVTPMQILMAMGAVANGGRLMEPLLVKRISTADGRVVGEYGPKARRTVIRSETAEKVQRLMRHAVTHGTGKNAALTEWAVAGKTGTARKWQTDTKVYSSEHYYGSFVGFLPVEDPQLAVVVIVDEPTTVGKAYYGGTAAAPVFAEIARGAASLLAIKPSPPEVMTNRWQGRILDGLSNSLGSGAQAAVPR